MKIELTHNKTFGIARKYILIGIVGLMFAGLAIGSQSSVTADYFFGDGSNLTGIMKKNSSFVCDGSTDNTARMSSIISNTELFLPQGVCIINYANLTANNVTIRGAGKNLTVLKLSTTKPSLLNITGYDYLITDVTFEGTGTENTVEQLIHSTKTRSINVKNSRFRNATYGISFNQVIESTIDGNDFSNITGRNGVSEGYGVILYTNSSRNAITNNHFYNVTRHPVYISSGSSWNTVSGNTMYNTLFKESIALYALPTTPPVAYNAVYGNTIRCLSNASGIDGIYLTQYSQYNSITNNVISGCYEGIILEGESTNTNEQNPSYNNIANNIIENTDYIAILATNANNNSIQGNTIKNVTQYHGIMVTIAGGASGSFSYRNLITGNRIDKVSGTCLRVGDAAVINTVSGLNSVSNCATSVYTDLGTNTNQVGTYY